MEQNSFRYDANIKLSHNIPETIEVKWGEPPMVNMMPEMPVSEVELSDSIESVFMLQSMMVVWGDGRETLVFVDFAREQVHSLTPMPKKLLDAVTRLIKEKKASHLPPIPTEVVTESIRRKNSVWNNHQEQTNNARKAQFED